jgi:hypothetical protein
MVFHFVLVPASANAKQEPALSLAKLMQRVSGAAHLPRRVAPPEIQHQVKQHPLGIKDFLRAPRSVQAGIDLGQQIDSVPDKKHWIFGRSHRISPQLKIPN